MSRRSYSDVVSAPVREKSSIAETSPNPTKTLTFFNEQVLANLMKEKKKARKDAKRQAKKAQDILEVEN